MDETYYTHAGATVKFTVSHVRDLVLSGAFREPADDRAGPGERPRRDDTSGTGSGESFSVQIDIK